MGAVMIDPQRIHETPAQKAARRKHAKSAIALLLQTAVRMEKARLPLILVTGGIGEAWAVAEYAMLPTGNAAAPFDGWLPDGRTVDVKCRYEPKSASQVILNPAKRDAIDLLLAVELTAEKTVREVFFGSYAATIDRGHRRQDGTVGIRWRDLASPSDLPPADAKSR